MSSGEELVVVYRSADPSAGEQVQEIRELLEEAGLSPVIVDDSAPGVPLGAHEVRVPAGQAAKAEEIIRAAEEAPPEEGDASHDLDPVPIFSALGATAEVEALGVRSVLEANGIPTVYVSPPQYPNLRFVVKVPRKYLDLARKILAEAEAAGPQAAEEAERAGEE